MPGSALHQSVKACQLQRAGAADFLQSIGNAIIARQGVRVGDAERLLIGLDRLQNRIWWKGGGYERPTMVAGADGEQVEHDDAKHEGRASAANGQSG